MAHPDSMPAAPSGDPSGQPVEVSAGIIFDRGRLLITRRFPEADFGGLWEFPGGKREPGESFEAALQRELIEELGIETVVEDLVERIEHRYPTKTVIICFFLCRIRAGTPQAIGCHSVKWVHREELQEHAFPGADSGLLEHLVREDRFWKV
jgi:mutator protein MutT